MFWLHLIIFAVTLKAAPDNHWAKLGFLDTDKSFEFVVNCTYSESIHNEWNETKCDEAKYYF